jgi:signal transduction histidine kinase
MKKQQSLFRHILVFVLAQVAWLSLLGLWIYWFVSNQFIFNRLSEIVSPGMMSSSRPIALFVGGIVLLVGISTAMSLIFRNLNLQLNVNRMYDNFIANVTHELKSPLTSIQMYLETMDTRPVHETKQKEFIKIMLQDTRRLYTLINSILDISRLEQKKVAHNFNVHNAQTLFRQLVHEAREQYRMNELIKSTIDADCQVVADKNALQIVINNLIDNAIKYSAPPARIEIFVQCTPLQLVVKVRDYGIGIQGKHQKKIFQKFHRVYEHSSPSVKGTGLGLYWVREIIKYHGGKVMVDSPGKNRGACFTIILPVYPKSKSRYVNKLLKLSQKLRLGSNNDRQKETHSFE